MSDESKTDKPLQLGRRKLLDSMMAMHQVFAFLQTQYIGYYRGRASAKMTEKRKI